MLHFRSVLIFSLIAHPIRCTNYFANTKVAFNREIFAPRIFQEVQYGTVTVCDEAKYRYRISLNKHPL